MLNPFEHRKPDDEQIEKIQMVRLAFEGVLEVVEAVSNKSGLGLFQRYACLSRTALEEACQWAIKGILFE